MGSPSDRRDTQQQKARLPGHGSWPALTPSLLHGIFGTQLPQALTSACAEDFRSAAGRSGCTWTPVVWPRPLGLPSRLCAAPITGVSANSAQSIFSEHTFVSQTPDRHRSRREGQGQGQVGPAGAGMGRVGLELPDRAMLISTRFSAHFLLQSDLPVAQQHPRRSHACSGSVGPVRRHWGHVGPGGQRLPAHRSVLEQSVTSPQAGCSLEFEV